MSRDELLRILADFFELKRQEFGIVRIGMFGSAARDELRDTSDVDIVVEVVHPDMFALIGIKQDLEEWIQKDVDVVRYRERMNPFLKARIEKEAVYV